MSNLKSSVAVQLAKDMYATFVAAGDMTEDAKFFKVARHCFRAARAFERVAGRSVDVDIAKAVFASLVASGDFKEDDEFERLAKFCFRSQELWEAAYDEVQL